MKQFIAFCGLDCETCEARLATVNHDDTLRQKVAGLWSELNGGYHAGDDKLRGLPYGWSENPIL